MVGIESIRSDAAGPMVSWVDHDLHGYFVPGFPAVPRTVSATVSKRCIRTKANSNARTHFIRSRPFGPHRQNTRVKTTTQTDGRPFFFSRPISGPNLGRVCIGADARDAIPLSSPGLPVCGTTASVDPPPSTPTPRSHHPRRRHPLPADSPPPQPLAAASTNCHATTATVDAHSCRRRGHFSPPSEYYKARLPQGGRQP